MPEQPTALSWQRGGAHSASLEPGACNALDLAKLLFAFIVVGIHQTPVAGDARIYSWLWMGRLAVPFFFVASAFLFFLRNPGPAELRKYVVRMLKLYGFWFVVMLPYTIYLRCDSYESVLWNAGHLLHLFVTDSTFGGSWFLAAMLISIPLVYYSERLIGLWGTLGLSLVAELFLQVYGWKSFLPHETVVWLTKINDAFPGVHTSFLAAMIYVSAGLLLARYWNRVARIPRRVAWGIALGAVALMAVWIVYMEKATTLDSRTFMRVPAVVLLFIAIMRSDLTWPLPYRALRKASTVVYISHFLFIFLLLQVQTHFLPQALPHPVQYLAVLTASLLLTALLVRLQRWPRLSWLKYAW